MLFWTLMFIFLYGYTLIYGNFLAKPLNDLIDTVIKIKGAEKDGNILTESDKNHLSRQALKSIILSVVPAIIFVVAEIIYFTTAIPLDPFKYPSLGMLLFVMLNFVYIRLNTKKQGLETDEGFEEYKKESNKIKRYTLRGWIIGFIKLAYFLYMFWILSFGIY